MALPFVVIFPHYSLSFHSTIRAEGIMAGHCSILQLLVAVSKKVKYNHIGEF